jgi:hypothetical protein
MQSELPQPVFHISLDVDRERAPSWDLQRRVRNDSALFGGRIQRCFDVVNEPIRSNDGRLGVSSKPAPTSEGGLMNQETLSTAAAIGTFIVIAATAIAAIVQLRHLRTSNQLTGLLSILGRSEDPQFSEWREATRKVAMHEMTDAAYRKSIEEGTFDRRDAPWLHLYNRYDYIGSLVKQQLVPERSVLDVFSFVMTQDWDRGLDIIAVARRGAGPAVWENFEYLVARARIWHKANSQGAYPRNAPRIPVEDRWLAVDRPV